MKFSSQYRSVGIIWDHSSAGRASALQAEGHRFEPYWSHCCRHGSMAEQLICNQQVVGSTPTVGFDNIFVIYIYFGRIPEWPKGADCKSAGTAFEGSNPSPPINIIAGQSSLEARRAHNPKVTGSNPVPATLPRQLSRQSRGLKILVSLVRFRLQALIIIRRH